MERVKQTERRPFYRRSAAKAIGILAAIASSVAVTGCGAENSPGSSKAASVTTSVPDIKRDPSTTTPETQATTTTPSSTESSSTTQTTIESNLIDQPTYSLDSNIPAFSDDLVTLANKLAYNKEAYYNTGDERFLERYACNLDSSDPTNSAVVEPKVRDKVVQMKQQNAPGFLHVVFTPKPETLSVDQSLGQETFQLHQTIEVHNGYLAKPVSVEETDWTYTVRNCPGLTPGTAEAQMWSATPL